MNLSGRTAIVTGGAVRLGKAIAFELAKSKANIVLHYNGSESQAEETADEIRELDSEVEIVQANFEDSVTAAETLLQAAQKCFGSAEILINSAAIFEAANWRDTDESLWDRHLAINLKTPFFLSREFAKQPHFATPDDQPRGHIINLLDWRATHPEAGRAHCAYTIAKCGLASLTAMLAVELGPEIQVNGVAPGAILPPPGKDRSHLEQLADKNPLQRVGSEVDIVQAVRFLLESQFVTGEILHINGGEHLTS